MFEFDRKYGMRNFCLYFGLAILVMTGCKSNTKHSTNAKPDAKDQIQLQPNELIRLDEVETVLALVDKNIAGSIVFKWTNGLAYGSVYFETENGEQEQYELPIEEQAEQCRKSLPDIIPTSGDTDPSNTDNASGKMPHQVTEGLLVLLVYVGDGSSKLVDCEVFVKLDMRNVYGNGSTGVTAVNTKSGKVKRNVTSGISSSFSDNSWRFFIPSSGDEEETLLLEISVDKDNIFSANSARIQHDNDQSTDTAKDE